METYAGFKRFLVTDSWTIVVVDLILKASSKYRKKCLHTSLPTASVRGFGVRNAWISQSSELSNAGLHVILKLRRSYNRRNTGGVLDLHVGRWLVTIALAINYYVSTCGFNAQLLNSFYLVESTSVLFFFFFIFNKTSGCQRESTLSFFSFLLLMVINFQLASGIRSLLHIFWGGCIISSCRPC